MKSIKIITTSDSGGLIDQMLQVNKEFNKLGYKSSIIKINKFKDRKINNINYGDNVIFQMSAYGYQKKGMPLWLISEIKKIKDKASTLGIFFHELFINADMWNLRFIISIIQKYINIRLLSYCDYWITSNSHYARWLKTKSNKPKNYICHVHSNINHKILNVKKSKNSAVIFGTEGSRSVIYNKYFNEIKRWVLENNIILFDVGPDIKKLNLKSLCKDEFNIQILGKLSTIKIRNLFSKVSYGIFITPDELVDKSGVMAAYSFYKVCPINLFKLQSKNKKIQNKRFLKYFPNLVKRNSNVEKIVKTNHRLSKKNNLNKLIKTYSVNFK